MNKRGSLQSICVALGIAATPSREYPSYDEKVGDLADTIGFQNYHDADPIYKFFLDHLREDGNSYFFEMMDKEHGSSILIKYEGEDVIINEIDSQTQYIPDYSSHRDVQMNKATCVDGTPTLTKFIQNGPLASESLLKMESLLTDDSYEKFLSRVRLQDGYMVLEWEPGISIRYEENEASPRFAGLSTEGTVSSSGKELIPHESPERCISQSGEEHNDVECMVSLGCSYAFQYKEKLLEVLNKPYDYKEYLELMEEATERKPLTKLKHLRGMSISYTTKEKGLSYLDHHPDLAMQIEGANRQTALTLLRGFFFWLKNLSHEGAFRPWKSTLANSEMFTNDRDLMVLQECAVEKM